METEEEAEEADVEDESRRDVPRLEEDERLLRLLLDVDDDDDEPLRFPLDSLRDEFGRRRLELLV